MAGAILGIALMTAPEALAWGGGRFAGGGGGGYRRAVEGDITRAAAGDRMTSAVTAFGGGNAGHANSCSQSRANSYGSSKSQSGSHPYGSSQSQSGPPSASSGSEYDPSGSAQSEYHPCSSSQSEVCSWYQYRAATKSKATGRVEGQQQKERPTAADEHSQPDTPDTLNTQSQENQTG